MMTGTLLCAKETWIDATFRERGGTLEAVDESSQHFEFTRLGEATGENAVYGDGSGPLLELQNAGALGFLKQGPFLAEFEFRMEKAPGKSNPVSLLVAGNRNSPGNALGIALSAPGELFVVRYTQGEWRSDRIALNTPVPLFEWTRLAVAVQPGEGTLAVSIFINGAEVGRLESDAPLGALGSEGWLLIGGTEGPHRSLTGMLKAFRITLGADAPESAASPKPQAAPAPIRPTVESRAEASGAPWLEGLYPYRVEIALDWPVEGKAEVAVDLAALEEALGRVCPDPVDWQSFDFERCALATEGGQPIAGGFKLAVSEKNLIRNGALVPNGKGKLTGWHGSLESVTFSPAAPILGESKPWLQITVEKPANRFLSQPVPLESGAYYLLRASLKAEPTGDGQVQVQLINSTKKLMAENRNSYRKPFFLDREWHRLETLYRPDFSPGQLRITTGSASGGVADLSLHPCRWALIGEFPAQTRRFFLYYLPRAGHRLPVPSPQLQIPAPLPPAPAAARVLTAEANPALRSDFRRDENGLALWRVPLDWPLRGGFLETVRPLAPTAAPLKLTLPRGGRETVVLAVKTGSPKAGLAASASGVEAGFRRVCPIPVYDGPFPDGKWMQDRYDAMTPLDYPLAPPVRNGVHLVAVTVAIPENAAAGVSRGEIKLTVTPEDGKVAVFNLPVELTVKNAVVKPMRHFLTSFGGQLISFKYGKVPPFTEAQTSVADFHGVKNGKPQNLAINASISSDPAEAKTQPALLAEKYFDRMLDSYLNPQALMLFHAVTYDVKPNGEGKAPTLENWDFSVYDQPIHHYALERGAQWLAVAHTNGANISRIHLRNGAVYGTTTPEKPSAGWHQLSPEEFSRLVGDYYDAIAKNLSELGVLDRAVIIIDESAVATYGDVVLFARALRARPYAKQIRIAHTSYNPGLFKIRNPGGELTMEEAIDIPIPDIDEHFNFFHPEVLKVWRKPKSTMAYHVETDHMDLLNAGVSTALIPLQFEHLGLEGWYCWASFVWSLPYPLRGPEYDGPEYTSGPVINPWVNPFYHHGPGVLSWFYPPDPRGIPSEFTDTIIPSYRLDLLGDGIFLRALLEIGEAGKDDADAPLAADAAKLRDVRRIAATLWAENPVQWYPNPLAYRELRAALLDALP